MIRTRWPTPSNYLLPSSGERLERIADPKVRAWWERYLRGSASFLGVNLKETRAALRVISEDLGTSSWSGSDRLRLASHLFSRTSTEESLAALGGWSWPDHCSVGGYLSSTRAASCSETRTVPLGEATTASKG
jgi:hypothetical protein